MCVILEVVVHVNRLTVVARPTFLGRATHYLEP